MIDKRYWVALGAVSSTLGACSAEVAAPSPEGQGATGGTAAGASGAPPVSGGSAGTGGAAGSGLAAGTGATAGGGGSAGTPDVCVPGVPSTSQIPRMKNQQYDNVVRDLLGVATLPGAGAPPSSLLVADFDGSLTDIAWNAYQRAADTIAAAVMSGDNRSRFVSCDLTAPTCLADTIRAFGRKAFRRPLTAAEVASFERLKDVTPAGTPEEIAEAVLFAMLSSPSFLMVPELGQETDAAGIKLTSHEVAARLAFFLWGSVPDDALNAAADSGALTTKEQILAQAQRMIQDRVKTAPVVATFHRAYADMRPGSHWATVVNHDPVRFPAYTPAALEPMMAEMDAFFEEVTFTGGSFADLLLSNDNSATVWFQEMSDGNSHNLNNLPILQAGSCGGYFKVGQAVNVEGGKTDLTWGHSEEDCQNGETTDLDGVGTPANVATMPINKYFCNLMNAIGVKAGEDGFPLAGGTREVTHFGKYDDTTRFNTNDPAEIKNPGEYTELRGTV